MEIFHHVNWWAVAFVVSTLAKNTVTYMPIPGSVPGFISSPWYPMMYHGMQGILALNFTSSGKMLLESARVQAATDKAVPK